MLNSTVLDTTSSDTSSSSPTSADLPDNTMPPSAIAAAAIFSLAILVALCYLGYLLFCKIRNHRQQQVLLDDQEKALLPAQGALQIRPMSYIESDKKFNHDIIQIVVPRPGSSGPRTYESFRTPTPTPSEIDTSSMTSSPLLSPLASFLQLQVRSTPQPVARQSLQRSMQTSRAARSPSKPTSRMPHTQSPTASLMPQSGPFTKAKKSQHSLAPAIQPPSPAHHSPLSSNPAAPRSRSRSRPVHLYLPHRSGKPSPPTSRSFSPTSSSALLMEHPATMGRRLGDVSPGLNPEYPYPMTPAQVGDGRIVDGCGRGHGRSKSDR